MRLVDTSIRSGKSWTSMSPIDRALEANNPLSAGTEKVSGAFRYYQRKERLKSYGVRMAQLLLLVSILVFWEIAPRENWLNPMLTSYPSAIWLTFVAMLKRELYYNTSSSHSRKRSAASRSA